MGAPTEPDAWGERLPRRLGTASAVAVLVGSTIGSGIFRSPAELAEHLQTLWMFAAVWIVGGVVALAGALTMAELSAMHPRTGGIYVYIREAFGPASAFCFGWAELLILRPAAYGAIAIISAEYLWVLLGHAGGEVVAFGLTRAQVTAAGLIVTLGFVNIRGVQLGAIVQNASTVLKVGAMLVLVSMGIWLAPGPLPPPSEVLRAAEVDTWSAFGLALVAALWAYDGWSDVGFVSGEVKDPGRALPVAFIGGTAAIVCLYLAINAVYVRVVPLEEMAGRPLIAADVARALVGDVGSVFVSALIMVSTFGTLNGSMMTGPRVFFAMAEDRLFFSALARVHPRHGTPSGAIWLSIALGVGYVSVSSFGQLADQFVIGIWPFYTLGVAAVFVLRRRVPDAPRPYRTLGYPITPLLFVVAALFLLGNYMVREPLLFWIDVAVVLAGLPVYAVWRRRSGQRAILAP